MIISKSNEFVHKKMLTKSHANDIPFREKDLFSLHNRFKLGEAISILEKKIPKRKKGE